MRLSAILGMLAAAVVGTAPGHLRAQDAAPRAEPAAPAPLFRRVPVPGPGHTGPRITIQIEPGDNFMFPDPNAPAPAAAPEVTAELPPDAAAAWFWSRIDPALPADATRYWAAEALLTDTPPAEAQAVTPRLAHVATIARDHGRDLLAATVGTQVSPAFALAVIAVESAGRIDAVSHAGAQGLMQLIPATADRFGVADPFDPAQNIRGGVAYLDWLMEEFGRDPVLVLAAYNAGEGAVRRSGGVPDYAETRNYVPRVLAAWQVARSLCLTPPELVSDGCVFRPIATQ
ncbi:MAG: lytic transglycosylase domain-containing protein [Roseicyclus sp.]